MALPWPIIQYDPGTGPITLTFLRPARRMTPFSIPPGIGVPKFRDSVRHQNVASSGLVEFIWERYDFFVTFEMEYVSLGDDLDAWDKFMRWALAGNIFTFSPSAQNAEGYTFWMEETTFEAKWRSLAEYTFIAKLRKARPFEPSFQLAAYGST